MEDLSAVVVEKDGSLQGHRLRFFLQNDQEADIPVESDAVLREALQTQASSGATTVRLYVTAEEPMEVKSAQEGSATTHKRHLETKLSPDQPGKRLKHDTEETEKGKMLEVKEMLSVNLVPERNNNTHTKHNGTLVESPLVRELSSLDHEESILFLEHLQVRNARATLRPDVTGRELSALRSAAEFEGLGIKLEQAGLALILKNKIKSFAKSGIEQSILNERRAVHAKERALQRGVSPLVIARDDKDHVLFSTLMEKCEDIDAVQTIDGKSALHLAVELGFDNLSWLKECLTFAIRRGANLNMKTSSGTTVLHMAANNGQIEVVELLLEAKANPIELDNSGLSPMTCASLAGHEEIVSLLQDKAYEKIALGSLSDEHCVDLLSSLGCVVPKSDSACEVQWRDVLAAIADEEDESDRDFTLSSLGKWEANVVLQDVAAKLQSMRTYGVSKGILAVVFEERELQRRMSLLNILSSWFSKAKEYNASPLYLAAEAGDKEGVKDLLQCTPDIVQNESEEVRMYMRKSVHERLETIEEQKDSLTPLGIACEKGHTDIVSLLLSFNANIEALHKFLHTPLHRAAREGHADTVSVLISHKANIEAVAKNNCTPLHCAASNGHTMTVSTLLSHNAHIEAKTVEQRTPLYLAAREGNTETVNFLISQKALIGAADKRQNTPLHVAAHFGHTATVSLLLLNKANIEAKGQLQATPLLAAVAKGHADTVSVLLTNKANIEAMDENQHTPLHTAVKEGHTKTATLLISHKANIEATEKDQLTALHVAAKNGHTETASLLLKHKANIEATDMELSTPLHWAAHEGHVEMVSLLISLKANIEATDTQQSTPLHWATFHSHNETVSLLITRRANIEAKGKNESTPLQNAAQKGHTKIVFLLIANKANIEATDKYQYTSLHWAAKQGHTETVSALISHKANIQAKDKDQFTPLHIAAENGHTETVSLLLTHRANIEAKDKYQYTPLHWAAQQGHTGTVSALISHRANIEAKDEWQSTSLHLAALKGYKDIVSLLLTHKINIEMKGKNESTALHFAAQKGHTETVSLLIANKVNIDATDKCQFTSLLWAAQEGHLETVSSLISHRANIEAKDEGQNTPLHIAAREGHKEIVALLLTHEANIKAKNNRGRTPLGCASTEEIKVLLRNKKQAFGF